MPRVTNDLIAQIFEAEKSKLINALAMFRPTVAQDKLFRAMMSDTILEAAVTGRNRGGKSVALAIWYTSVALDEPVTMRNGEKLYMRPRRWAGQELLCWAVGYDWKHIGESLYRLLFKPGLFKVIKDQATGMLRSYDPATDKARKSEVVPCPVALITNSMVKPGTWSWESKKDRQLQSVQLKNNTRIVFYASTGEVAQGNPVHIIWVDEKIQTDAHYPEWLMRLVDYEGRIVWSSWPTMSPSGAFIGVLHRAAEQLNLAVRRTISFEFRKGDNPYTENETLDAALATMSEEEAAARGDGQVGFGRWKMYPRFSKLVHRVMSDDAEADDKLAAAVRKANGIPGDWTRYLVLDPGTANCGVVMCAVPPVIFGDYLIPYDELYMHYAPAKEIAEAVAAKTKGQYFEDFIIDSHAARQTPMGFDGTIGANYEKEFAKCGLRCKRRGSRFSFGSDNVEGRILRLQGMMNIRADGTTKLRIIGCTGLVDQIDYYRRKADPQGNPTDKPADHQKLDLVVGLEYIASRDDIVYVKPQAPKVEDPRSITSVVGSVRKFLGIKGKPREQAVYCGAGRAPS